MAVTKDIAQKELEATPTTQSGGDGDKATRTITTAPPEKQTPVYVNITFAHHKDIKVEMATELLHRIASTVNSMLLHTITNANPEFEFKLETSVERKTYDKPTAVSK